MPGSTPTAVPRNTPISANTRFIGCSATTMPCARALKVSMMVCPRSPSEQSFERPSRQAEREKLVEHQVDDQRQRKADGKVDQEGAAAERRRRQGEQDRGGEDEPAAEADDRDQRHQSAEDQQDRLAVGALARRKVAAQAEKK